MLQFPYAVYPNGQALDGSVKNNFFCTISGTICTAYQVNIYNNNTNDVVYSGTKTNVVKYNQEILQMEVPANSFSNGNDLIWSARLYTNTYDIKVASNTVIGSLTATKISIPLYSENRVKAGQKIIIDGTEYIITNYEINNNAMIGTVTLNAEIGNVDGKEFKIYSNFIDMPMYFFKARTTPIAKIQNFPTTINSREYSFIGTYSQSEGVAIQYYTFNLYDKDGEVIDTTGKIYSANINYKYDGFINGSSYMIELICNNQDNIEVSTDKILFNISYSQPNIDVGIGYQVLENKDAIRLIIEPDKTSIPTFDGKYKIIENFPFIGTNSAQIKNGIIKYDNVSQEPLLIDKSSFSVFMSTRLENGFSGKIIELNGDEDRYIELVGYTFYDNNGETKTKILDIYTTNKFVLQTSVEDDVGYIWDNTATWDNTKIWCFPLNNLSSKQFKINILPTSTTIMEV
jgi:hypothetical protein